MMGFALLISKPRTKLYNILKINNTRFLKFFQIIITFHLVAISFLVFRSPNLQTVSEIFSQIFNFFHIEVFTQFVKRMPVIFALIVLGYIFHFMPVKIEHRVQKILSNMPLIGKALLLALAIWFAVQFKSADIQPFIYFQF